MKLFQFTLLALWVSAAVAFGQQPEGASGLKIERAAAATAVENREPVGEGSEFPAAVGSLFCFTEVHGAEGETAISHVWYFGEQEMARIKLTIRAAVWRTWSQKTIVDTWKGDWRVEVVDESNTVLATVKFKIL